MNYIKRDIEYEFLALCQEFPIVLVTGVRQAGKSTMLEHHLEPGREKVTLDDLDERGLAQDDPELFLQAHRPPVMIDEVQYAPQLFPYLKMYADSHPGDYGAIWVTGSQPFKLMRLAGESLAGRAGILHLLPLSQSEAYASEEVRDAPEAPLPFDLEAWRERTSRRQPAPIGELYRRMWRGTMPAVVSGRHADPSRFYRSYQQTYIERDVRELDRAADMVQFSRFMSAVASQVGQLLNVQSLARDLDMSRAKAQEWLGILERSDVIFLLQPYSNNSLSRTVSTPKLYFNDTGLAAWLGRWTSPESLEVGAMAGPLFENHVVSEFRKALNNTGDRAALWFYRDRDAREVDLVVERDATLHPVEIKRSANPRRTSTKAFPLLDKSGLARGTGLVVCMKERAGVIDAQSLYVPAWAL